MFDCQLCKDGTAIKDGACSRCGASPVVGLGDLFAAIFRAIGITEKRVSRVIGKPCGCKGRREKLNSLFGVKRQESLNRFGDRVMAAFKKQ